ncbi:protein MMS22-like [Aedes aegypti]|uniref:Protein MMS22-like n=1 Tax=Aedes aegypti TaxID=7159 RepID=A0A1S4FHC3_AEDAE|nr:protein MMS22-like [Aedes aegypti]
MFNCKKKCTGISRFVDEDVRKMLELEKFKQCNSISFSNVDDDSPVEVFGYELFYLDDETLRIQTENARDYAGKLSVEAHRDAVGHFECRRQIAELGSFLRLILGEVDRLDGKVVMDSMYRLYDSFPELVTVVEGAANALSQETYDYFHGLLEFWWYGLIITFELQQRDTTSDGYETMYRSLLEGLIQLAMFRYSRLEKSDLPFHDQFYCTCVRNIWIGIMSLSMSGRKHLDFWEHINNALESIRNGRHDLYRNFAPPANDFLFVAWFINGIASLYQYCILDVDTFKESAVIVNPPDYTLLDRAVKEVTHGDKPEDHLRILLVLLKPIYTKWWPVKHDFLFSLWEYFSKRLNSPFQLASEPLSKLACICRSPIGLIEQARCQADPQAFECLDTYSSSFKCYLTIIAFMVRHYSDNNQKTKVQILFNRTVLKLVPAKIELLTEQGIYNYSLLMLTVLESTPYQDDYHRLSKQMLHFKLVQPSSAGNLDSTIRRITMICLANAALVMHFSQRNFDKGAHLQQFLKAIDEAWMKYGNRLQPALHVLADAMGSVYDDVISGGRQFGKGDERFVGVWVEKYLNECSGSERDALFQNINRLFRCLRLKQPFHVQQHNDVLRPLYEIVLPFVEKAFTKADQPCPIIAELAAHFTLFSIEQPFVEPFLASFSFFADNVDANSGLRLSYTKLIVKSDRVSEIDDMLIIKCWLKFAIINSAEQLTELSQVVLGLSEFRSLCDIPSHDLIDEGEEPIGLFFKFVGKKFKECENNSAMQFDLKNKMHVLFQQFDKWIPNPNVALLKRILSVLALALKECGPVVYIRNNSTCLYHLAVNHYFLPMTVLTDRNVSNELVLAMGKMWFRIMDAMGQMDYEIDPVLSDHVTNMIVKWAPQFLKFKEKKDIARPYVMFISSLNEPFITFAVNRYLLSYVELDQMGAPKPNAETGLTLLLYTLEVLHDIQDNGKIAFFIRLTATSIMDHATKCHDVYPSKAVAVNIIFKMLDCTRSSSNLVKLELRNSLASYTKRHLPVETGYYFRFMSKLAEKNPEFIQSMTSTIREELIDTERLRGGKEDKHLRRLLFQLEGAVEASINKQKP